MNLFEGALLGLVQGLTEFLPVSSSGHLVLAHHALGLNEPALFTEVMLHAGTLVAVLAAFSRDLIGLGLSGATGAARLARGVPPKKIWADDPGFRLLIMIALATVPVGIAGFLGKHSLEALGGYPAVVGAILIVNGLMLLASRRLAGGPMELERVVLFAAVGVGVLQVLALLPGISRSGVTIVAALALGMSRDAAGRYSFLLAVPAVTGATVLELWSALEHGAAPADLGAVLVGTVVAAISGYAAIRVLLHMVRTGRLFVFGPYCILVGIAAVLLVLL